MAVPGGGARSSPFPGTLGTDPDCPSRLLLLRSFGSLGQLAGGRRDETPLGRTLSFIRRMTGKTKVRGGGGRWGRRGGHGGSQPGTRRSGGSLAALTSVPQFPLRCRFVRVWDWGETPSVLGVGGDGPSAAPRGFAALPPPLSLSPRCPHRGAPGEPGGGTGDPAGPGGARGTPLGGGRSRRVPRSAPPRRRK